MNFMKNKQKILMRLNYEKKKKNNISPPYTHTHQPIDMQYKEYSTSMIHI